MWFRAPSSMFYLYVLKSKADSRLYIGYTRNLGGRLEKHQRGDVLSTKSRRPLELIFYEAFKNRLDAKRRERYFKTSKGKSSLRQMLRKSLG